ncbi:MAG: transcriptional repressor [Candidatus Omnitrophica bacterium]|nr:transcriptional repressor [Candidatus Omnitrophota bacterium]
MAGPYDVFNKYLKTQRLKFTHQREEILKAFLGTEKHVTTEELYAIVRKRYPYVGHATVFRTLKLMCEADLARRVGLGDKAARFEHKLGHPHHDHLVCSECGKCIEATDDEIERLQLKLAKRFSFTPKSHKMEIYGICKDCGNKVKKRGKR